MDGDIPCLDGPRNQTNAEGGGGQRSRHKEAPESGPQLDPNRPPTVEQIRAAMAQLAGLVMAGIVSPGRASVIQRIFEALIRSAQTGREQRPTERLDVKELRNVFRDHPRVADAFAPFLSGELLDQLLRGEDQKP